MQTNATSKPEGFESEENGFTEHSKACAGIEHGEVVGMKGR